jgi:NAD(P)-dependent dehydrogenase (short-subunit alcohol dehydrogenase family)
MAVASPSLGVVITGGSLGIGYALAAEFLRNGDRVVVCGRNASRLETAVDGLEAVAAASGSGGAVFGIEIDVSKPDDVQHLGRFASKMLTQNGVRGSTNKMDVWINNAGQVGTRGKLSDLRDEDIVGVVSTNLLGALLCCKEAQRPSDGVIACKRAV